MPSLSAVMRWLGLHAEFQEQYARARELQAEYRIDEINEIADEAGLTNEEINKAKLRIDTRKWAASKLAPKKYGDKVNLDHSGGLQVKIGNEFGDV